MEESSMNNNGKCPKCGNTGMVREKDGTCHTCWDCLAKGNMNQHSDKLPESKIKL